MKIKKGQKLWEKAKNFIPMGTCLFSKKSEIFLPEIWPSYFSKAKGIKVWDLDGNEYFDFSIMGVGTCILGYSDPDVNRAVKNVIDKGNMCTLNSPEEVELAELFLKIDPWAGMVRYARTGGEAMAIAVRIARTYTGKEKVAFCGYHGWHDWYLSANIADDRNLDGHLLPGLKPLGVPRVLKGTSIPFNYNKIEELEEIVKNNDIGVIVIETVRNYYPENNFLKRVRDIATKIKAVMIMDEITSGFRLTIGGAYKIFGIEPDIVVYGKAISNGYPMAAIVGKKEIMKKAEESFISSTYWTERIGPTASISTIKKMKEKNVPDYLIKTGEKIKKYWQDIADEYKLKIKIMGISSLPNFKFDYENSNELMTLFTYEMLKRNFLAKNCVYVSYSHKEEFVEKYLKACSEVFKLIKIGIEENKIKKFLKCKVAEETFKRLT